MMMNEAEAQNRNVLADERGMTIIEILTTLLILGMVAVIIHSFLFMGISMYKRVTEDTQLRNQGDVLFSQVISEVKDAVYAMNEEGSGTTDAALEDSSDDASTESSGGSSKPGIVYVKRAVDVEGNYDPKAYVSRYTMRIEHFDEEDTNGIAFYKEGEEAPIKTLQLTPPFTIDMEESKLTMNRNNSIGVYLVYSHKDERPLAADNTRFVIDTEIPLFRIE